MLVGNLGAAENSRNGHLCDAVTQAAPSVGPRPRLPFQQRVRGLAERSVPAHLCRLRSGCLLTQHTAFDHTAGKGPGARPTWGASWGLSVRRVHMLFFSLFMSIFLAVFA